VLTVLQDLWGLLVHQGVVELVDRGDQRGDVVLLGHLGQMEVLDARVCLVEQETLESLGRMVDLAVLILKMTSGRYVLLSLEIV